MTLQSARQLLRSVSDVAMRLSAHANTAMGVWSAETKQPPHSADACSDALALDASGSTVITATSDPSREDVMRLKEVENVRIQATLAELVRIRHRLTTATSGATFSSAFAPSAIPGAQPTALSAPVLIPLSVDTVAMVTDAAAGTLDPLLHTHVAADARAAHRVRHGSDFRSAGRAEVSPSLPAATASQLSPSFGWEEMRALTLISRPLAYADRKLAAARAALQNAEARKQQQDATGAAEKDAPAAPATHLTTRNKGKQQQQQQQQQQRRQDRQEPPVTEEALATMRAAVLEAEAEAQKALLSFNRNGPFLHDGPTSGVVSGASISPDYPHSAGRAASASPAPPYASSSQPVGAGAGAASGSAAAAAAAMGAGAGSAVGGGAGGAGAGVGGSRPPAGIPRSALYSGLPTSTLTAVAHARASAAARAYRAKAAAAFPTAGWTLDSAHRALAARFADASLSVPAERKDQQHQQQQQQKQELPEIGVAAPPACVSTGVPSSDLRSVKAGFAVLARSSPAECKVTLHRPASHEDALREGGAVATHAGAPVAVPFVSLGGGSGVGGSTDSQWLALVLTVRYAWRAIVLLKREGTGGSTDDTGIAAGSAAVYSPVVVTVCGASESLPDHLFTAAPSAFQTFRDLSSQANATLQALLAHAAPPASQHFSASVGAVAVAGGGRSATSLPSSQGGLVLLLLLAWLHWRAATLFTSPTSLVSPSGSVTPGAPSSPFASQTSAFIAGGGCKIVGFEGKSSPPLRDIAQRLLGV